MTTVELLCAKLSSVIEVTEKLCAGLKNEDFSSLAAMLDARGELLDEQSSLFEKWSASTAGAQDRETTLSQLHPLLDAVAELDKKMVTLFTEKKRELAEKIVQGQNQQRLLVYSR